MKRACAGERAPVGIIQGLPASYPAVWKFCGLAKRLKATVVGDSDIGKVRYPTRVRMT